MAVLWSNDLVVGVDTLDNQHKGIFIRINNMLDAMILGQEILHVYKEVRVMWLNLLCNSIQKMFCQSWIGCKMDMRVGT